MAPELGSNMFRQTVATMIWGMTTGRMKSARYRPRKQSPLVFRTTAIPTPMTTWTTTLLTAHQRLKRTSRMNSKLGMARRDWAIRT